MPVLMLGVIALVIALWGLNAFAKADVRALSRLARPAGGVAAIAVAAFLGLEGKLAVALPVGIFGLSLLGWLPSGFRPFGIGRSTQKSSGQNSRVRSAFVEMELDHDTGAMRGHVLAGPYEGRSLDTIPVETLVGLLPGIDAESGALLAAYLDRRSPGWREHSDAGAATGQRSAAGGKLTEQEAYQILGLQPGASPEEIGRSHRSLMKKLHPDQGGSTSLAARVNEAKEVLLRRHR